MIQNTSDTVCPHKPNFLLPLWIEVQGSQGRILESDKRDPALGHVRPLLWPSSGYALLYEIKNPWSEIIWSLGAHVPILHHTLSTKTFELTVQMAPSLLLGSLGSLAWGQTSSSAVSPQGCPKCSHLWRRVSGWGQVSTVMSTKPHMMGCALRLGVEREGDQWVRDQVPG